MKDSRYIIGIDLGTTNSALSYIDTEGDGRRIETFEIPQLVNEGTVKNLKSLPSFLYLPGEYELPEEAAVLPWDRDMPCIVGEFARLQGTRVPAKLISSAKSWLCHNRVDREGPILPWGREGGVKRMSPVEASSCYLRHMKDAWNHVMSSGDRGRLLENQKVIITIPASFDESARELTAEAAKMAGIEEFTMLEEPQAAFYAWLSSHEDDWRDLLDKGRLVLVFDVGGGTTDFTLISLNDERGMPSFRRAAVGDHIMLGGDNMDLTLARTIEIAMMGPSGKFDYHQWLSASHQCRAAKEKLLGDPETDRATITVLGTGRGVVAGARKAELRSAEVEDIILDGFFKKVEIGEELQRGRTAGLQEMGLPFVSDTAIMKHLSSFLKRHAVNKELVQVTDGRSGLDIVRPDILLFNGGVFKSQAIRKHAADGIREWFSGGTWDLTVIENDEFDQAVATGAAYYGLVLRGRGQRISGGAGKAYYIAVEKASELTTDLREPLTLVCIVPRGIEEGEEVHLSQPEFQVMTNSPVLFSVYSSSYRVGDRAGDIITAEKDEFIELPHIRTILHYGRKARSVTIPVSLGIRLNEFGTLDVWCESKQTPHRWKLAFQLRTGEEEKVAAAGKTGEEITLDESSVVHAIESMEKAFSSSPRERSELTPENVIRKMEKDTGTGRKNWPLYAVRKMWDSLMTMNERRRASPVHEARWFNLSGFLLRPGFGYQLDEWRIKELWKVYLAGPEFPNNAQCRSEWWVQWRRVAGGFDSSKQEILFGKIAPWLLPSRKKKKTPRLSGAETGELWMLAASLEHLSPSIKTELGDTLLKNLKKEKGKSLEQYYWALSRIGARSPFHGPIDRVVSKETAERWIEIVMKGKWSLPKSAAYAVAQLARKTDDRLRDIDSGLRKNIIERLSRYDWSGRYIKQISEVVPLEQEDEKKIFGESLPVGLHVKNQVIDERQ